MPTYNQPKYRFSKKSFEREQETLRILSLPDDEYEAWKDAEQDKARCRKCGLIPTLYGLHDNGICNDCYSMRHTNN